MTQNLRAKCGASRSKFLAKSIACAPKIPTGLPNTRTFAGSRIAVLAALKIAEDYYQLKKDYDELLQLLDENK